MSKLEIGNLKYVQYDNVFLIPAIIQDESTGKVLMLAYMTRESLARTIETGYTCFYSRSRKELWEKGQTSGNVQKVKDIFYDCDADTLLIKVEQTGVACHEGAFSCFSRKLAEGEPLAQSNQAKPPGPRPCAAEAAGILNELYNIINERKTKKDPGGSYTAYLFEKGQDKILKKVGEESAETIIASKNNDQKEIICEMADLWYHCLVLMAYHDIPPELLLAELKSRRK